MCRITSQLNMTQHFHVSLNTNIYEFSFEHLFRQLFSLDYNCKNIIVNNFTFLQRLISDSVKRIDLKMKSKTFCGLQRIIWLKSDIEEKRDLVSNMQSHFNELQAKLLNDLLAEICQFLNINLSRYLDGSAEVRVSLDLIFSSLFEDYKNRARLLGITLLTVDSTTLLELQE